MLNLLARNVPVGGKKLISYGNQLARAISISPTLNLKQIEITEDKSKKRLTIEGKYLDGEKIAGSKVLKLDDLSSSKEQEAVANEAAAQAKSVRGCAFCQLEKKGIFVQYSDVLVLRQFLAEDGRPLSQSITGLCHRQYRKLLAITKQARYAGLILNLQPKMLDGTMPSTDPRKRDKHLKWNSYFEKYEKLIRTRKYI
jgi:small subunit ribosomal protein S18